MSDEKDSKTPSISISLGGDDKPPTEGWIANTVKKVADVVAPPKEEPVEMCDHDIPLEEECLECAKLEPKVEPVKEVVKEDRKKYYYKKHPKARRPGIPSPRLLELFDSANTLSWQYPEHYGATYHECDELVKIGRFRRKDG